MDFNVHDPVIHLEGTQPMFFYIYTFETKETGFDAKKNEYVCSAVDNKKYCMCYWEENGEVKFRRFLSDMIRPYKPF